jgi:hypothetical protein
MPKQRVGVSSAVPLRQRFRLSYKVVGECWEWVGVKNRFGYGKIRPEVAS